MKCPKCEGEMEKGKISPFQGFNFRSDQESKGIVGFMAGPLVTNIEVYRCKKCGYLESYAK